MLPEVAVQTVKHNVYGKRVHQEKMYMSTCTLGTFYAILLSVFTGLYILANTRLPLACIGVAKDDTNARGWIRLSMWGVALFVAGGVSYWQKAHDKRYALY